MAFSKVHQQMRKQHHLRTRKIAAMIDQHFKKKKGEKERLAKEREQNLKNESIDNASREEKMESGTESVSNYTK